ncbi:hypothetical protein JTE90_023393 [Oedothorax gibbosus]|uniref:Major facilitator superfamily (MFS) profile domain-containing protein n=1 Tax=Oedothorax gibbosus TaxID=931172 RepID=A0AAV6UF90_9ARAC|nr:hypothetical protein JTE90_023393 [Oedothorax gibbosus]
MEDNKASQTMENVSQEQIVKNRNFFQCRYFVALMGFFTFAIFNVQVISTSVSIVAMVNNSKIKSLTNSTTNDKVSCVMNIGNTTKDLQHESKGEFDWDPQIQGYVLGAANLGFVITHMPGGLLAEMAGAKITLLSGILIASVAHVVSPFAAWAGSYYMIAVLLLRGLGHGVLPPSNFVLAANWIPRHERGMVMTFICSGICVGAIVGGMASGALCASDFLAGWPSVYYIFGSLGILLSLCYALFVYNSPSQHPRITDSERMYIIENQETDLSKKRPFTPWRAILTSVPFYAMVAGVFGNFWAAGHFLSVHPTFLGTILHFSIQELFQYCVPTLSVYYRNLSGI